MKGARILIWAAALSICLFAVSAEAADFSADMVSMGGGGTQRGKIFMSQDKIRMELPEAVTITRLDKKLIWILMPKDKMYMQQPLQPGNPVPSGEKMKGEIERKLLGKEMLDGRMTDKYQVTYQDGRLKQTVLQWLAPGIAIPVKTAAVDNSWSMEYKNIKIGRQPDALFELPADYQNMSVQMPSMKDLLGDKAKNLLR
jgi:hypothetical protein